MALNDPFTLDLFGNTSLSSGLGFGVTAFPAAGEPDDADRAVSSTTPAPALPLAAAASKPAIVRGENFHLDGDRGLAKSWRDRARENIAAIRLAAAIEAERSSADGRGAGETHPLHRLWRVRARQRRLQAPGRGRVPERLGGDRRRAQARCRRQVLRLARALHAVRPLHAGIHRPSGLDGCDAARLPRRPGARTRHRQRPVSGVDAGSTARLQPRHRRRTRSGDRPDRETLAAACEDPQ